MADFQLNILIIDDDPEDARLLKRKLDPKGMHTIYFAESLEGGIGYIEDNLIHIVLLDLTLPDSTGIQSVKRFTKRCPNVPVVVITGLDDEEIGMASIQHGAQDYLVKGKYDHDYLIRCVHYAIERHEAKERFRLILETAQEGFISVDEQSKIIEWNKAAEKIFGWSKEEVIGLEITETVIPESLNESFRRSFKTCLDEGKFVYDDVHLEFNALHKMGYEFPVELSINCLMTKGGMTFHAFIQDITERKRLEKMKDEFIAMASHELRTPLAIIKTGVANLNDGLVGELTQPQLKISTIIEKNTERLNRIVDNLLDVSRLESGVIHPRKENIDLKKFFGELSQGIESLVVQKGLQYIFMDQECSIEKIEIDPDMIGQVIHNFMNNALRYAATKVVLNLKSEKNRVIVAVGNDGSYLSPEDQKKLFKKFSQVRRPSTGNEYKGTGLGLAISKEIIELHEGRIWVESVEGEVTWFLFSLPHS